MLEKDLVCFSHLRWGFVFQRPNHLMSRFARNGWRVLFVEEPRCDSDSSRLETSEVMPNLWVCTPHLGRNIGAALSESTQRELVQGLLTRFGFVQPLLWFYTPMAVTIATGIKASLVVYDCMDELSCFRGAPKELVDRERLLFARADLVFTGGRSLYEAKRELHPAVHAFPSSVDREHYLRARVSQPDPEDQRQLSFPRLGYFGVIDERIDLGLIAYLAQARPAAQIVMVGPTVKVELASLPRAPNIHYLGQKTYAELPGYIAGWQVAMMPFALNDATRFISPTKTLEYLAAGKPVVSTAIRDVVSPYGECGMVSIADQDTFPSAIDRALDSATKADYAACDHFLDQTSWDKTWAEMFGLVTGALKRTLRTTASQKGDDSCLTISS